MFKLTDHLLPILQHIEKFTSEAQGLGGLGLSVVGLAGSLISGVIGMLERSAVTIPVSAPPIAPPTH